MSYALYKYSGSTVNDKDGVKVSALPGMNTSLKHIFPSCPLTDEFNIFLCTLPIA